MGIFFNEDDELLEKCNSIWNKFNKSLKKELNCEPLHNKKILKTKIRSYGAEAIDFHDKVVPKKDSNYTCLAIILIDFAIKKDESYYPQVLLKKCKYTEKKKVIGYMMKNKLGYVRIFF